MTQLVLGLGHVGSSLFSILESCYLGTVFGFDIIAEKSRPLEYESVYELVEDSHCIMHICFPWSKDFVDAVQGYAYRIRPALVIVHSTVPIGTTAQIPNAVHSPVLGRHDGLQDEMTRYLKWIGGPHAAQAEAVLGPAGFRVRNVPSSDWTEALKLLDLAKYGVSIAFAHYSLAVCDKIGMPFSTVIEYDCDYNNHVEPRLKRPLIAPLHDRIGGQCVTPGVRLLERDFPHPLLEGVLAYE